MHKTSILAAILSIVGIGWPSLLMAQHHLHATGSFNPPPTHAYATRGNPYGNTSSPAAFSRRIAMTNDQQATKPEPSPDNPSAETITPEHISCNALRSCSGCEPATECGAIPCKYKKKSQWFACGWLDQGYTFNPDYPPNRFNSPLLFNDRANEYQMNQLYLSMGREINKDQCCWDFGGRVDLLYGTDYLWSSSLGLETFTENNAGFETTSPQDAQLRWNSNSGPRRGGSASIYGLSMPQLYAEFYAPIGYGMTCKIGHFYSIMGYESIMAPKNFFYSHSYSMMYGEPFTHTGMLLSYQFRPNWTMHGGLTRGWDTWEDPNQKLSFLAGLQWESWNKQTTAATTAHIGNEDITGQLNRTSYSFVATHQLSPSWHYVFQHDLGFQEGGQTVTRADGSTIKEDAYWYSFTQYLFYQWTANLAIGARAEWFRDDGGSRIFQVRENEVIGQSMIGSDYSNVALGLNWKPTGWVTVRPEVRWDWSGVEVEGPNAIPGLFNNRTQKDQFTFAVDLITIF